MADDLIAVEVAYAEQDRQSLIALEIATGSNVEQAISASGILRRFPDIKLNEQKVGIFGSVCELTTKLGNGDRVEIYRPLRLNPMDARRERVRK